MNQPAPSSNQKRLDAARRRRDAAFPDWTLMAADGQTIHCASDGPEAEQVLIVPAGISFENHDFAVNLVSDYLFVFKMFELATAHRRSPDRADRRQTPARPAQGARPPADYAAECAMRCNDPSFRRYLAEVHRIDISDAERIKTGIRKVLAVTSRADLNRDPAAARRWRDVVGDFEAWERGR